MHAFLQSDSLLTLDVYAKPKGGIKLINTELLKLLKALYGLTDSGDYWHYTMANHHMNDLHMEQPTKDLARFVKIRDSRLHSINRVHLDDPIGIGNEEVFKESLLTSTHFESMEGISSNITFAGLTIE